MTTQDFRPEVEERLLHLDPTVHQPDAQPVQDLITAYMTTAHDAETRDLARQVFADHRELFDLIGDR